MNKFFQRAVLIVISSAGMTGLRAAETFDSKQLPFDRLSALLDQATFRAVSPNDLDLSRAQLLRSLDEVPGWIEWDDRELAETKELSEALLAGSDEMRPRIEYVIIELLQRDEPPYGEAKLVRLRQQLRRHLQLIDDSQRFDLPAVFQRVKIAMRDALNRYEQTGNTLQRHRLVTGIRWFECHDQANEFVLAAKQALSFPNLEIRVPAHLVRRLTTQSTQEYEPVARVTDGIASRGSGLLSVSGFLEPVFSTNGGRLSAQLGGEALTSVKNSRDRIQFRSSTRTQINATALIAFDSFGFMTVGWPQVCAVTDLRNCRASVDRLLGKRIIGCLANRAIARKTPEAECAISRELAERVESALKTQLDERVSTANQFLRDRVWPRVRRLDLEPRELAIQSTSDGLRLAVTEDNQCGLAADRPCPFPTEGAGYAALHESLATDLLNIFYVRSKDGPAAWNRDAFAAAGDLPVQLFGDATPPGKVGVRLNLDFPRPFRVDFSTNRVSFTIRAKSIELQDVVAPFSETTFSAHDLTLGYCVSLKSNATFQFRLLGKPKVSKHGLPHGEVDQRLVEAIQNELFAGLLSEFQVDSERLIGDNAWPLQIDRVLVDQGWILACLAAKPSADGRLPGGQ